jgi:hypothetical protein
MTPSADPGGGHPLGIYSGQPVMEGDSGRLACDCEPESGDGCLMPVPAGFPGMPCAYPQPKGPEVAGYEATREPEAGQ